MSDQCCDRCHCTASVRGDLRLMTYVPPFADGRPMARGVSSRLLCHNCIEFITDAMDNIWPERFVEPDVTMVEKDYTQP